MRVVKGADQVYELPGGLFNGPMKDKDIAHRFRLGNVKVVPSRGALAGPRLFSDYC
ncbi:MAG: hypothetical protein MUP40_06155 [Actinobacteria bacterium]|nr:hypothetical protein [Actinomycetota bacterium]